MEKRLSGLTVAPVGAVGRFIPDTLWFHIIVIFLLVICGIVSGLSEVGRKHLNAVRHGNQLGSPVELSTCAWPVAGGDQGGPCHTTDGGIGVCPGKFDSLLSHLLNMGSGYTIGIKKLHVMGGIIFRNNPDEIWFLCGFLGFGAAGIQK